MRTVFVMAVVTGAVAAGGCGELPSGDGIPHATAATPPAEATQVVTPQAVATQVAAAQTVTPQAVTRKAAAPIRVRARSRHGTAVAVAKAPVARAHKPVVRRARPAIPSVPVWTSGFQAQLDACRGAVDLSRAYGVATIGEKWTCGGARFPRSGSLVRLTGIHSGVYRVGRVVATLNAYVDDSGDIPRGYALLFQTCVGDNPRTESFAALTRVG